jgi:hypothetical protein
MEKMGRNTLAKLKQLAILGDKAKMDKSMIAEVKTIILPSTLLVLNAYGIEFFGDALPVIETAKAIKNSYENRLGNYIDLTNFKMSLSKAKDIDTLTVLADSNRLLPKFGLTGDDGVTVEPALYLKQLSHNVDILSSIYQTSCSSISDPDPADIALKTFGIVRVLLKICLEYDAFIVLGRLQLLLLGKMTNSGFKSLSFINFQKRQSNGTIKYPTNVDEVCACLTGFENAFCVLFAADYRGMFTKFINHLMLTVFNLNLTIKYTVEKLHVNFCLLFHYFGVKSAAEFPLGDPAQLAILISNHLMNIDFSQQDQAMLASGNPFIFHPDQFVPEVPETKWSKKKGREIGRPIVDLSNYNVPSIPSAAADTAATRALAAAAATAAANAAATAANKLAAKAAAALANQNNTLG